MELDHLEQTLLTWKNTGQTMQMSIVSIFWTFQFTVTQNPCCPRETDVCTVCQQVD